MKKILLIACLFVGLNTVAQNRLEFNQVITIDTIITLQSNDIYSNTYTVPVGKTWKIEYFQDYLEVNGTDIRLETQNNYSGFVSNAIWLKEGDDVRAHKYQSGGWTNGNHMIFFLSAIEFNIVQ
jgi:hypothetical protein